MKNPIAFAVGAAVMLALGVAVSNSSHSVIPLEDQSTSPGHESPSRIDSPDIDGAPQEHHSARFIVVKYL